jgi:hypothetical protein
MVFSNFDGGGEIYSCVVLATVYRGWVCLHGNSLVEIYGVLDRRLTTIV